MTKTTRTVLTVAIGAAVGFGLWRYLKGKAPVDLNATTKAPLDGRYDALWNKPSAPAGGGDTDADGVARSLPTPDEAGFSETPTTTSTSYSAPELTLQRSYFV